MAQHVPWHVILPCYMQYTQSWLKITKSFIPAHLSRGQIGLAEKVLQGGMVRTNHKVFTLQIVSEMA